MSKFKVGDLICFVNRAHSRDHSTFLIIGIKKFVPYDGYDGAAMRDAYILHDHRGINYSNNECSIIDKLYHKIS
jgi:hypothetical protein